MGVKYKGMPDFSALESLGRQGQGMANNLGQQQIDFARAQYDQMNPVFQNMASINTGLQSYNADQGKAMGDMYRNTYMPMMQEQANAARNFNTEAHREGLAQQAAADTARAFTNQQAASGRSMAAMGINPNSGRFAGMQRGTDLALAAARAGAMTGTRRQAEAEGLNRVNSAIAGGQNLGGMASQAFGTAMNAGNMAGNLMRMPGQDYMAGLQGGQNMMMRGHQFAANGLQGSLDGQMRGYESAAQERGALYQGIGQMAGMAGGFMMSDRRLKTDVERVGEYPNGLPMYEFNDVFDRRGTRWRGVMADDVEKVFPDAVLELDRGRFAGFKGVDYGKLGIDCEIVARRAC